MEARTFLKTPALTTLSRSLNDAKDLPRPALGQVPQLRLQLGLGKNAHPVALEVQGLHHDHGVVELALHRAHLVGVAGLVVHDRHIVVADVSLLVGLGFVRVTGREGGSVVDNLGHRVEDWRTGGLKE